MSREVVIVTGASKGIGKAISEKLASNNYDVIIFGRNTENLQRITQDLKVLNSNTTYFSGDVADKNFVNESVAKIISNYGKIDALINNAGVAYFEKFIDSSLVKFKEQIDTNLFGVYNFSKAVIDQMIKQNSGTIINISSQAGKVGFEYGTMYAATKHAVMGFSRSLMLEVRKHNIRVISVCPGSVETDMIKDSPIHPEDTSKILQSEDIAEVVFTILKLPTRALVSEIEIRPNNP